MDFVNRFLTFDKLIGATLVKVFYYLGLVGIAIMTLGLMFSGFSQGFLPGIGMLIFGPIIGFLALLYWRFVCEIIIIMFKIGNDLGEVRAILAGNPGAAATGRAAPPPPGDAV